MGSRSPLPELLLKSGYDNAHQIVLSTESDDHLGVEHRLKGGMVHCESGVGWFFHTVGSSSVERRVLGALPHCLLHLGPLLLHYDEGVDVVGDLVHHLELLHPRESQKLNASMIPTILANQRHDQSGMYSTKD